MGSEATLKPGTSIKEQIEKLRSRGMEISDAEAQQWLQFVSYYRLSGYWFPSREIDEHDGSKKDSFEANTCFANVTALYEADRKLRTLIHDGVERIEVAFRTQVVNLLSVPEPLAYQSPDYYRPKFKINDWCSVALRRIERVKKHNTAVKHYIEKYNEQYPLWVLAEVLDFSDVSKLYQGLKIEHQTRIAEALGVHIDLESLSRNARKKINKRHPLSNWLEQLTVVRNACAHHARVWNKSFVPAPTGVLRKIPMLQSLKEDQSVRIYGVLLMIAFLLETISPGSTWKQKVKDLIDGSFLPLPMVMHGNMGLPNEWPDIDFWCT